MRFLAMPPFRAEGNAFIDKLKTGAAKMSDPTGIAAAKFLQTLGKNYFEEGFSSTDYTTSVNLFTSGRAAIFYMGTWELPSFLGPDGNLKPNIGYFPMPVGSGKDATPASDWFADSGIGTAITTDADTPEMQDFLKYLFGVYADRALYQGHYMPSLIPTMKPDLPEIYKDILGDIAKVKTFAKVWDVQLDPNTVDTMGRQDTDLELGLTSVDDYARAIDSSVQNYVNSN
jgi:raffinose/stachyose/melibiose transport system substrate-binding protein